ncbi:MAG: hypothetical protein WCO57_04680 [Verrucomicrobiota bacterium]
MTVNDIAIQLLTHFSPEERTIPDSSTYPGRNAAVLLAINGALQEMFTGSAPWVRQDIRGVILHAPAAAVSIDVVNGSTAAVISVGTWQAWFAGCAIAIDGSAVVNQIRNDTRATILLKFPHDGTTGTKTATVYQTSVEVATDMMIVTGPVIANGVELNPIPADQDTYDPSNPYPLTGRLSEYRIDSWSPSDTAGPRSRIVLHPAPDATGFITYKGKIGPPAITSLASTATLPVPLQFIESLLLPLALKRLQSSTFFLDAGRVEQINADAKTAKTDLANLNPGANAGIRLLSKY